VSGYRKHQSLIPIMIGISICLALAAMFINFQVSMPTTARATQSAGLSTQANNALITKSSRPSFAGKVLHWAQTNYNYTRNGPDPANGKAINGDIWVIVGSDGLPTSIHARYTLLDGTFLQEFLQTRQGATFFFSSDYHMPGACSVDNKASSTKALLSALPQFLQESSLQAEGYIKASKKLNYPEPVTTLLAGVNPLQVYNAGGKVHSWFFSETLSTGMKHSYALDIDADGRLLASEAKLFDTQGTLIEDSWATYGQLQVYSSSDVPGTITALTQKGGCHA
jgi:hypothetical protein